jgi:hypothetical protein
MMPTTEKASDGMTYSFHDDLFLHSSNIHAIVKGIVQMVQMGSGSPVYIWRLVGSVKAFRWY